MKGRTIIDSAITVKSILLFLRLLDELLLEPSIELRLLLEDQRVLSDRIEELQLLLPQLSALLLLRLLPITLLYPGAKLAVQGVEEAEEINGGEQHGW